MFKKKNNTDGKLNKNWVKNAIILDNNNIGQLLGQLYISCI